MELMELLKAIFNGEALTFEQFADKVNQSADIKLGNLAGGQYVDKNKYDDLSRQLDTANANLEGYDPEWKSKLEQAQADGEKKLNDYKFEQSVENLKSNMDRFIDLFRGVLQLTFLYLKSNMDRFIDDSIMIFISYNSI